MKPGYSLALASALFCLIAVSDYLTTYELSFTPLYTLTILLVGWNCGAAWGSVFALLSAASQLTTGILTGYPHSRFSYFLLATGNRLVSYFVVLVLITWLRRLYDREKATARIDFLTGAANRRSFHEILDKELARHQRSREIFSVAYLDCDDFKTVNDRLGHAQGDEVLRVLVRTIKGLVRRTDTVARLGGDEFAILLPSTDASTCVPVIEKIRDGLDRCMSEHGWPVTFSIGVRTFEAAPGSPQEVIAACDSLMYRMKDEGKNRLAHETFVARTREVHLAAPAVN